MSVNLSNFLNGYIIKSTIRNSLSPVSLLWKLLTLDNRRELKVIEGNLNYNFLEINNSSYKLTIEPFGINKMVSDYHFEEVSISSQKSHLLVYETTEILFIYTITTENYKNREQCLMLYNNLSAIPEAYLDIDFNVYQSYYRLKLNTNREYKPLKFDDLTSNILFEGTYRYNISVVYFAPIVYLYSNGTGIYIIWSDHIQRISTLGFDYFLIEGYYFYNEKMFMAYDCYYFAGESLLYRNFTDRHEIVYNAVYNLKASIDQNHFIIYSQNHHTLDRLETFYERAKELSARQTSYQKFGLKFISNGSPSIIFCHLSLQYKNLISIQEIYRYNDKNEPIPIYNYEPQILGHYSLLYSGDVISSLVPYHLNYYSSAIQDTFSPINILRLEDIFGLNTERFEIYYHKMYLTQIYERLTRTTLQQIKRILWIAPRIKFRPEDHIDLLVPSLEHIPESNSNINYITYDMIYEQYDYIVVLNLQFKEMLPRLRNLLNAGGIVYVLGLNNTALKMAINPYNFNGYISEFKMGSRILTYHQQDNSFMINGRAVSGFNLEDIPSDFKLIGFKPQLDIFGAPQSVLLFNRLLCISIMVKLRPQEHKKINMVEI